MRQQLLLLLAALLYSPVLGKNLFPSSFVWNFRGVSWMSPAGTRIGNATVTLNSSPSRLIQTVTDAYNSPGPLWRPAGTWVDTLTFTNRTKVTVTQRLDSGECRSYSTPSLPGEDTRSVAAAFENATYGGLDNETLGCEPTGSADGGCEIWIAARVNNPTGARSLLWRRGAPVWLNGFGVYSGDDSQVSFYTLSFKEANVTQDKAIDATFLSLDEDSNPAIMQHQLEALTKCPAGCMAQVNSDFQRCQELFATGQYCDSCKSVHAEWAKTAASNCTDSDFDFEVDIPDTREGWHCQCEVTPPTGCFEQPGPDPGGYKCTPC